jgi:hypothetical protein
VLRVGAEPKTTQPPETRRMNGPPTDAQTKALEFVNSASTFF